MKVISIKFVAYQILIYLDEIWKVELKVGNFLYQFYWGTAYVKYNASTQRVQLTSF